jgi:hypothetical protein
MCNYLKVILLFFLPQLCVAESWQAATSTKQMPVVELFTSEGCGACPPADRWAKQLSSHGLDDDHVVVLGFHIDYLNDRKGWVDKFAKPEFSDRQRQLVLLNLYKTVFTPQIIISGETIHAWEKHATKLVKAIGKLDAEADIKVSIQKENNKFVINTKTIVRGEANQKQSKLYIAITEDDIKNVAFAGDNRGTEFNHQNLVRKWLGPFDLNTTGDTVTSTEISIEPEWQQNKLTVVAIVQNLEDGFVLQALPIALKE